MSPRKLLDQVLRNPTNVRFADFVRVVEAFGFVLDRSGGSHRIYKREGIPELVNLQERRGQAKPYQIRQFLKLVEQYNLRMTEHEK